LIHCTVSHRQQLNQDVYQFILKPEKTCHYFAGQYLNLLLADSAYSFSIANAPGQDYLELHIRQLADNPSTTRVINQLCQGRRIKVELPLGQCYLSEKITKPTVLLVGSTGFAQAKAMLEYLFNQGLDQPCYLYWGAHQQSGLYANELVVHWQQRYSQLAYVPVLTHPEAGWDGRTGLVHQALLADFASFADIEVYASGSPKMVYAAFDGLTHQGLNPQHMHADVFAYAPRP
jgi:CDP-4-dehydro-6-deoxyglucose reductase